MGAQVVSARKKTATVRGATPFRRAAGDYR